MSAADTETQALASQVTNLERRVRSLRAQLRTAEMYSVDLANDIVMNAPDCWDGDESCDAIAVQYVRALEEVAQLAIGRMPMRGDDLRAMLLVPGWADRAVIEPDEDRGIDGDPDDEVRYDGDGRGWHVRQAA